MMSLSLSLSWTYQRDRVSLLVKFGLNKNNFIFKKNDNNVVSSREVNKKLKVSILYIYIYTNNNNSNNRDILFAMYNIKK